MISAGRLNRRVRFYAPTFTNGEGGEQIPGAPAFQFELWSEVRQPSAKENLLNGATVTQNDYVITVRFKPQIATTWTAVYSFPVGITTYTRTLEISAVITVGNNEETQITAHETKP
jgi:head-tail adaptor